jgi:hypothetical protein
VSRNIAAARAAKADAEGRRDAKQAEHDAFEELNRGEVRARHRQVMMVAVPLLQPDARLGAE